MSLRTELLMLIRDMALWNSEVKKMLTMYVLVVFLVSLFLLASVLCIFFYHEFGFCYSLLSLSKALPMQAIKVLNMIKLYGKPIRVNKVMICH